MTQRRSLPFLLSPLLATTALGDVIVELDLDADLPGRQAIVAGMPGDGSVRATVTIRDPDETHNFWTIGYLGGLDRGIALGHVPRDGNHGSIIGFTARAGTPANPANTPYVFQAFQGAKAFEGWEVQYCEWGADAPATIAANPPATFEVTIDYEIGLPCDEFYFYLADYVTIWRHYPGLPDAGAFSTLGPTVTLDTGGDAQADLTDTLAGLDADSPVDVPPASFRVDYVDGPEPSGAHIGGPAIIEIVWPGDLDIDRHVGLSDLAILLSNFGNTEARYTDGDITGDAAVSLDDLAQLLVFFGDGCRD